jgi:hypothetical protein
LHGQNVLLLTIQAALLFSDLFSASALCCQEMPTLVELPPSCQFHEKKNKCLLKTNKKISNSMTKEATMLLPAVAASWTSPMQRSGCSFLPGDASIGGMTANFPCQFHKKETKWLLKTNKMSHFMTNEGTALLPAVVASWVSQMQRSGCSFLPGDSNVSGMAAIPPCQFHEKKTKWLLTTNKI